MIRRAIAVWAAGFLAATLISTPTAFAQGRGGGGYGGGMGMAGPGMVSIPAVQKELKMTDEQGEKAREFGEEYRTKSREMMSELEGMEGAERTKKMQELNRKHFAAGMKEVEGMLKPEQTKRFKQIVFQTRGIDSLTDPEVAKELKVTPDQADRIRNLMEAMQGENRAAMAEANGDRAAGNAAVIKNRKAAMTKALAMMTPEQATMVREMSGEPFEMPAMGGGGGGRPGR